MAEVIIRLEDISIAFDGEVILDKLNLEIKDKEFVTLLGPSGCGKTTTLRIIGGFTQQDSGNVFFAGKKINKLPPHKRNVNTVFQKYALFPHLNVFENVAFGLRISKTPKNEIPGKVKEMLKLVDLSGYENRSVSSLSGGQQQRVAIARALINHPNVLLLDEPLGALDLKLRKDMQLELKNMQQKTGITFIYVTHDQEEALTMSDTVVVMNNGVIQQIGSPQDIYNEPINAFVADFIGESNIIDGKMTEDYSVSVGSFTLPCVDPRPEAKKHVDVVVRPEDIQIVSKEEGNISGIVESSLFKGVHYEMTVNSEGKIWLIHSIDSATVGETIGMKIDSEDIHIMKKMYSWSICEPLVEKKEYHEEEQRLSFILEGKEYSVKGVLDPETDNDSRFTVRIPPEAFSFTAADEGDFNAYVESVIWKADHYEILFETEGQQTRYLASSQMDEQAGTTVGVILDAAAVRLPVSEPEETKK